MLFSVVILLVFQILDVEAINSTKYIVGVCDATKIPECINQTATIHDKDKQIAELQNTEILTLSVALVFGGIAIYSEIKRWQNNKKLRGLISSASNKISNAVNDKKDEKQTPKVSGSMDLDFSDFLLGYTKRFFFKAMDIANLSIVLTTLFIAIFAVIVSISNEIPNDKMLLLEFGLPVLVLSYIPPIYLSHTHRKNNENIFKIERIIIQNYDYINGTNSAEKDCILEEFKQVFTKKKDVERLIGLLSRSNKD